MQKEQIKNLISKMSLEEKCSLLSGKDFWQTKDLPERDIPSMFLADGPHGIRKQAAAADHLGLNESLKATCFPTAVSMANTWDTELAGIMGEALGTEAVAQKVNVLLGPGMNIKRNPKCGRNFEYYSEDPYLAGKMAASYIKGIQAQGVAACAKHFAANNQEEKRMVIDTVVDERALREIYLTAFEMAVKDGGVKAVMSSYNRLNGTYANENEHLLKDILRKEWDFDGLVVTDWGGNNDRVEALKCGNELEMPTTGGGTNRDVFKAVSEGRLDEGVLDENLERLLKIVFETSETAKKDGETNATFDVEKHHRIAKNAAESCIVLLKNENGVLPLAPKTKIAVVGDFARLSRYQGAGSSVVNPTKLDHALDCIKDSCCQKNYDFDFVGYEPGFKRYGKKSNVLIKKALKLSGSADVTLLYIGLDENTETEGLDRENIRLPQNQTDLIKALRANGRKVVAILSSGGVVETDFADDVTALIYAGLGGQAVPKAVWDVVAGVMNPCGKLSETYPMRYEDCPSAANFPGGDTTVEYRESIFVGYRYYDTAGVSVRYPFGYGLSYTSFEYSNLTVTNVGVRFMLKNTGRMAGAEICQMYIGASSSKIYRPAKELKGFKKVFLRPGESKEVEIPFDEYSFRYFNVFTNDWETEPCEYEIYIGASVADIRLSDTISKAGAEAEFGYSKEILPSYYGGRAANASAEEFCILYGRALPDPGYKFIAKKRLWIDSNTTVQALRYSKGWAGRFFAGALRFTDKFLRRIGKVKTANMLSLGVFNMPVRGLSRMTGGMISWGQLEGLIIMFNGRFFKGCKIFFKEGRIKKKLKKKSKDTRND